MNLKIILIANYLPDRQESMLRFARAMSEDLTAQNISNTIVYPTEILRRFHLGSSFLQKWLGYIDKFLLYPFILSHRLRKENKSESVVHICDHSNTPYASVLKQIPHLATCHDLTAIKSSLGIIPHHKTRLTGKFLQKYIMRGLRNTSRIVCISNKTEEDLHALLPETAEKSITIYNGFNYPYSPMPSSEAQNILSPWITDPFMLHVGGDSWYKNRIGTLELYSKLLTSYTHHKLVMVGPPPSKEQQLFIETHHLSKQVIFVESIDNETLRAFYSSAYLLLFPSHEEGFGWPIIEAQACGCPVAVIDRNPMREIAGPAGILLPETPGNKPDRAKWAQTSAEKIKQALELDKREALVEQGLANIKRFSQKKMVNDYLKVYKQLKA